MELYVPVNFFSRNKWFWKNIYHHNHFRFLDGNFPGLSQKNSGRFISSAFNLSGENFRGNHLRENKLSLIAFSRIFTLFTFLWIYANFYWQCCQNLTLRFHRIVFMGRLSFEKNLLNCISLCRRKYFGFMAKRFLHAWSELLSLCPLDHSMKKDFLKNLVSIHEEIRWKFLGNRRKNFERVVRTALYMPGAKFHEKFFYEKNNSFPDTRRTFSWFIAKRVFRQELQNRSARVKRKLWKNSFEIKWKICVSG